MLTKRKQKRTEFAMKITKSAITKGETDGKLVLIIICL